jgi:hypothetical protein
MSNSYPLSSQLQNCCPCDSHTAWKNKYLNPPILIPLLLQKNRDMFEMHRLVQLAMKHWLKLQGKWAYWQRRALVKLEEEFPVSTPAIWPKCEALYPHACLAAEYRFDDPSSRMYQARLMYQMACYELSRFNLNVAHARMISVCECSGELQGRDHIRTLISRLALAEIFASRAPLRRQKL